MLNACPGKFKKIKLYIYIYKDSAGLTWVRLSLGYLITNLSHIVQPMLWLTIMKSSTKSVRFDCTCCSNCFSSLFDSSVINA